MDAQNFNLSDAGFVEHLRDFGQLHVAGAPGSRRWQFTQDGKGRDEFMADPYFQRSIVYLGKRYTYTAKEMETHWQIMCKAREILAREWTRYVEEESTG